MSEEFEILNETEAMKTRTLKPVCEVPRKGRFWRKADIVQQAQPITAPYQLLLSGA
jgi:hypothetical protein